MENSFEFVEWTDEQLRERGQHLGEHIVFAAEQSPRRANISREISHLVFELTMRTVGQFPGGDVQ